jgi:hypothetical protein
MHVEWALRQPGVNGRSIAFTAAANKLNERNIESPMGGRWQGTQLQRMAPRLGLNHPKGSLAREVARARVHAIWKQHPDLTGKRVIASLGLKHLLGIERARQLLRECRLAAAKRSPVHRKVGWWLDCRTAARIRISAICKRYPEYTAKQVLNILGPEPCLRRRWVRRVMNECWKASGTHRPKQLNGWTPERRARGSGRRGRAHLRESSRGKERVQRRGSPLRPRTDGRPSHTSTI